MEHLPNLEIIGSASSETKELAREFSARALYAHDSVIPEKEARILFEHERDKTSEELELIGFADVYTSELLEQTGVTPFSIGAGNIHMISNDGYAALGRSGASATQESMSRAIFVPESTTHNELVLGSMLIHEFIHSKSRQTIEVTETDEGFMRRFSTRTGIGIESTSVSEKNRGYRRALFGLNEAITEELTISGTRRLLMLPRFDEYRAWVESEEGKEVLGGFLVRNPDIDRNDIFSIQKTGEDDFFFQMHGYAEQRAVLKYLIEGICNTDGGIPMDNIRSSFVDAYFSKGLLSIAKPIERVFGKGSFDLVAQMSVDPESANECLEELKRRYV